MIQILLVKLKSSPNKKKSYQLRKILFQHKECLSPSTRTEEVKIVNDKIIKPTTKEKAKAKNKVFCSDSSKDQIYVYSLCLLHASLSVILRRNALSNLDVNLQEVQNKEDFQFYIAHNRRIYQKISHLLIVSYNNCVPRSIAHDEKFNSSVNSQGKPGRNICADHMTEFEVRAGKKD